MKVFSKKISIAIVSLFVYSNLQAQTHPPMGPWLNPSGTVTTETANPVGIGTSDNLSWLNVKYCEPVHVGQLIRKEVNCNTSSGSGTTNWSGTYNPIIPAYSMADPDPDPPASVVVVPANNQHYVFKNYINLGVSNVDIFGDHFPYNSTSYKAPLFWARQEGNGSFSSRFIVMPDGMTGINSSTPRAPLDVQSNNNFGGAPVAYFGVRAWSPTFAVNNMAAHFTQHLHVVARSKYKGFNSITKKNDVGIFFTDGLGTDGTTMNGSNADAGFVIAPWSEDQNTGGLRMDNNGNIELRGDVRATKLTINAKWWPDFVFKPTYNLMTLDSLRTYIATNGHLPHFNSEEEVKANGTDVGETQAQQQQTIEELTLYTLQQENALQAQKKQLQTQAVQLAAQAKKQAELESLVNQLLAGKK